MHRTRARALWIACVICVSGATACQAIDLQDHRMCTISDENFLTAATLFTSMALVFRNPRCINCHGAVDPFAANTSHAGGGHARLG